MKIRSLTLLLSLVCGMLAGAATAPKYIFYYIGDGMGMAHVLGAQVYNRMVLGNDEPILMMQFPVASQCTTHSASSPVTDSAAAGTALATGHKTRNGMLGMTPDSVAVKSIAAQLHDRGYGVGLITSVPPDDATPGAFYAHVPKRSMYYEIGKQMAENGYEFQAGSHLRGLKDKKDRDTDLLSHFEANEVRIAHGIEQIDTTARKVLLLNPEPYENEHQIGFTIDSLPGALNLPEMVEAGLAHMERVSPDAFFMMVEGGNIDYGGHANDGGAIIKEVINFNQALRKAYDFYLAHPEETLIVVTADHETGGMGLGNNTVGYDLHLNYLDYQKISKDRFADLCRAIRQSRRIYEWGDMEEFLRENMGFWGAVPVTDDQTAALREEFERCFKGEMPADKKTLYNSFNTFTEMVYGIMDSVTGLGFTTNGHSGGLVPVYAIGVGAEMFGPMNDNRELPEKLRELTGVK